MNEHELKWYDAYQTAIAHGAPEDVAAFTADMKTYGKVHNNPKPKRTRKAKP